MDRRSWLWRRKSSEKGPGVTESSGSASSERHSGEQATMASIFKHPAHVPMWRGVKVAYLLIAMCLFPIAIGGFWAYGNLVRKTLELEKSVENLNEQLSSVRSESNAKDDLLAKQAKVAEEAISGWEKAEARALALQKQLDDALLQKKMAEERLVEQDTELQEFRQQLIY
ncbi:hypothetical protein ZIOFF_022236 [Zingiber officinale]|uniref:Uncharacterized protein n=1 Tax=Zingiber officinale TaxID=94328 RepID=A0A8J5HJV8_ZINOF|nr:hypothetical protein ZIOFF_022236 [Zingiber officinale]